MVSVVRASIFSIVMDTQTFLGLRSSRDSVTVHLPETRLTVFQSFCFEISVLNWLFCMCYRGWSFLPYDGWVTSGHPRPQSGSTFSGKRATHRFLCASSQTWSVRKYRVCPCQPQFLSVGSGWRLLNSKLRVGVWWRIFLGEAWFCLLFSFPDEERMSLWEVGKWVLRIFWRFI